MIHFVKYLGLYLVEIILFMAAATLAYKAINIYGKTKKTLALLLSITFALLTLNHSIGTMKIGLSTKTGELKQQAQKEMMQQQIQSISESIKKKKTKPWQKTVKEVKEKLKTNIEELEQKHRIASFFEKNNLAGLFYLFAFLLMLFVFYRKLKKINYKSAFPKIMLFLCSFFMVAYIICGITSYVYGKHSCLTCPIQHITISQVIAILTFFLFRLGVIILGILAYKKSKDIVYFYLATSFVFISFVIGLIIGIVSFGIGITIASLSLKISMPVILNISACISLPLYLYAYYLSFKALKKIDEQQEFTE